MKARGSRVCSGAIVLFAFVCLLLAGAGRLIASESDGQRMPDLSQRQAWLCAAPNAAQEPLTDARQEIRPGGEHRFPPTGVRQLAQPVGQTAHAVSGLPRRGERSESIPPSPPYFKKSSYASTGFFSSVAPAGGMRTPDQGSTTGNRHYAVLSKPDSFSHD